MTSPTALNPKSHIELFSKEHNSWIEMPLSQFNSLIKPKDSFPLNHFKDYKLVPNHINQRLFKPQIGSYVEFRLELPNMTINTDTNYTVNLTPSQKNKLTMWTRGKVIVSLGSNHYLIECNNRVYDQSLNDIRILSASSITNTLYSWSLSISPIVYKSINDALNDLSYEIKAQTYYDYDEEKCEFDIITQKKTMIFIQQIIELKQEEYELSKKYDIEIENEKKNLNKLNMILNSNFKEVMKFHIYFKESIEKEVNQMNIEYAIVNNDEDKDSNADANGKKDNDNSKYFSLILYSKNQKQLDKAKESLLYKEEKIDNRSFINLKEIESTVGKAKLLHFYVANEYIYLLGKEKDLNDFKKLWSLTVKYNERIQQTQIESENMKKELTTLKKQYKLK